MSTRTRQNFDASSQSVHAHERDRAIENLIASGEVDAARELIQLFEDCPWRATRLKIIRGLARLPFQRSLEFLFQHAQTENDVPVAEAAIWALGQSHHVLAERFLASFYDHCAELLKPAVVAALGQIPSRARATEFLRDLPIAMRDQKVAWARNLALSLGELKVAEAAPILTELARTGADRATGIAALISLGKIARDNQALVDLEPRFRDDLLDYQLYRSVCTQTQFRSQWRLEDYLTRIFGATDGHLTLPYELSHFDARDVREGLKLFSDDPANFEKLCATLGRIQNPEVATWYAELIDWEKLDDAQFAIGLKSIAHHFQAKFETLLLKLQARVMNDPTRAHLHRWLEAAALALPQAEQFYGKFLQSDAYRGLPESERLAALNPLIHFGLTIQCDRARLQVVTQWLDRMLEADASPAVQSRALRALANLGGSSTARSFAKKHLAEETFTPSALIYFEKHPDGAGFKLLEPLLKTPTQKPKRVTALLKALRALPDLPEKSATLADLIHRSLEAGLTEAGRLLAKHGKTLGRDHVATLIAGLQSDVKPGADTAFRLSCIVALKTIGDPQAADALAECLDAPEPSIAGRALDTLTALPGLRASRRVIDYLTANAEDPEICDKIIRALAAPETPSPYFIEAVDQILKNFPHHPQTEGLIALRDRLSTGQQRATVGGISVPDLVAVDAELARALPGYPSLDDMVKSVLRSAELVRKRPEIQHETVDKSALVLDYCKAVDLALERELGRRLLFPRLERGLHEFQNLLHSVGLHDQSASVESIMKDLGLEKYFSAQALPLHKMTLIASGVLSGRIVNESFRLLDGLRAWAVILLLFARRTKTSGGHGLKPLIPLGSECTDEDVVKFCRRLISLQDHRNPAAHRQTHLKIETVDAIRGEVFTVLNGMDRILK